MIGEELKENGICIISKWIGGSLGMLQQQCDLLLEANKPKNDYLFGNACRVGSIEQHEGTPIGFSFGAPLIWELAREWLGSINFTEIFITHEWRNDQGMDRNGFLHFDRLHTLKFIIYLTDVQQLEQGPFSCVPKSHKLGKKLREKGWKETNDYSKVKNRMEIDYPELGFSNEKATPIFGNAGDLVVFDTDLFHLGGNVQVGFERKLIRLHIRK